MFLLNYFNVNNYHQFYSVAAFNYYCRVTFRNMRFVKGHFVTEFFLKEEFFRRGTLCEA